MSEQSNQVFPISFDLYQNEKLLSRHSVRNEQEKQAVLESARRVYGDDVEIRNEVVSNSR